MMIGLIIMILTQRVMTTPVLVVMTLKVRTQLEKRAYQKMTGSMRNEHESSLNLASDILISLLFCAETDLLNS